MDESSRIFWFSGTGNSLYAAKKLSAGLDGMGLEQITEQEPTAPIGGEGCITGFVFPSYYCNLPRAVHNFVGKLQIQPGTYVFAIVTMGGPGQGSVAAMKKALRGKGLRLNYGRGILMPANNVLLYNPAAPEKGEKMRGDNDECLNVFAADIAARRELIKSHPFILSKHFKNVEKLDGPFASSEGCTGCGLCEKICPVRNIQLDEGKPRWLGRCELCVACISWCPVKAIEYGGKTKSRRRYRHPRVKVDDLVRSQSF